MIKRVYDVDIIKFINLFESLTGAKVKDCIIDDKLTFIVENGQMGLAIGKQGVHLKRVESALKKNIRVIEFDENIGKFVKHCTYPLKNFTVEEDNGIVKIIGDDTKTKGLLIGRDRANLKKLNLIVSRFFQIKEIIVV